MDSDGSNKRMIPNSTRFIVSDWSPDGSKILFTSYVSLTNYDLWTMDINGSNKVQLTNTSYDEYPAQYSPDGRYIAYISTEGGDSNLWLMNADGSNKIQLTSDGWHHNGGPRWSPDGTKIAFVGHDNNNAAICCGPPTADIGVITLDLPSVISFSTNITSPLPSLFPFATPINFTSLVTGGAPPYNYSWESSRDGVINTSANFNISNLSSGTHTITLTVTDANNSVATASKVITINGIDLAVTSSDFSFSNSWPMQNEEITINASIANHGSDNANNVSVIFYDGALNIGAVVIPSISRQSSGIAQIHYAPSISGYRLIKVVVDEQNNITESDETNNAAIRPIAVGNGKYYGGIEMSAFIESPKYTGQSVRIYGSAIYNTTFGSGENVAGAKVSIVINGMTFTTFTTSNGAFSININAPYSSGLYSVYVNITDNTFLKEDNSLMLTVDEWPTLYPDLMITADDITLPNGAPVKGEISQVNARVINIGKTDASNVNVSFYDDGNLIETKTVSIISGYGGYSEISVFWTPAYSGTHAISVKVDKDNLILETNENNNLASGNIYVYPDLPDFSPGSIYYSDSTPYEGQQVQVYAWISNIGGKQNTTNVSFYLDGIYNGTVPVSINGKSSWTIVSLPMVFDSAGMHQVKVIVDEEMRITEADEGNNLITSNIFVHVPQPDLIAYDIFLNITDPVKGDNVLVTGILRNDGETIASNIEARMYINGTLYNNTVIFGLVPGESTVLTSNWIPASEGFFDISINIDPLNNITESNEYNNIRTETYYVYPDLPDSHVFDLSFVPSPAEIDQHVTFNVSIENIGGFDLNGMNVSFYVDDVIVNSSIVNIPGKGGKQNVYAVHTFTTNGTFTVKVKADPEDVIAEFHESNNEMAKTIIILPPLPDLTVLDISFNNTSPIHNDVIEITAAITNIGKLNASNVKVSFYSDSIKIGETMISEVNIGETNYSSIVWTSIGGTHAIKAAVDPYNEIIESNELNNQFTKMLIVRAPDIQIHSEDIYYSNNNPLINETIIIYGNISNVGTYPAENISVEFYIDSIFINNISISSILNTSSVMVTSNWNAKGTGSHVVSIKAIYTGFELSGANNEATRGLVVENNTFIMSINGTVRDSLTRAGISGATVSVISGVSTITDGYGNYSLPVNEGSYNLSAKFEPEFYPNSTLSVMINSGTIALQDIDLVKKPTGNITGNVMNS